MHIGEPEIAAGVAEGEPLVVEAEAVENRRLQVVYMNFIRGDVEAEFVGRAMRYARLDATASQPHREGIGMVVAAT